MGEVYRADDLDLGASVALKLLPPEIAVDPARLERFRAEVRLARQISHPNVVRVYDISQADGLTFLSMEYVDGEDLGLLLRRIGRLPQDKAVQIARQICFALAAAHDQGVIHRDLKPANIMIDGRGNARIMDFGVAGFAHELMAKGDVMSGTPAYMAPEQLAGQEVSKRSDLYSLGLVFYELFTGKTAFHASSIAEFRHLHQSATRPESLSTHVGDLDPAIERVVLRCLESDPSDRPASAVAVAAALPGGDPLAAALAAGETPSPELIAASGNASSLSPVAAWARVALIAALVVLAVFLTSPWSMVAQVKPEKSREVLRDRAKEIIRSLGYSDPIADDAANFAARDAFISRTNSNDAIKDKAAIFRQRPGAFEFWYRQSPLPIQPPGREGVVGMLTPFPSGVGEIIVRTDSAGRLELFGALPPRKRADTPAPNAQHVDEITKRLFDWAALDLARFTPADPILRPFVPVDALHSWIGSLTENADLPVRVHLGLVEGRPAYFAVSYPWNVAAFDTKPTPPAPRSAIEIIADVVILAILLGTAFLAFKSLASGRGDRVGAFRIGLFVAACALVTILAAGHALPDLRGVILGGRGIESAVVVGVEFWLFYVALEPYVRRVYPQALVSWTRIWRGSLNDPVVGRHLLIGLTIGALNALAASILLALVRRFATPDAPMVNFYGGTGVYMLGFGGVLGRCGDAFVSAFMLSVGTMLPLVITQLLSKRRWLGFLSAAIGLAALQIGQLLANPIDGLASLTIALIPLLAIPRGGLLALIVTHATLLFIQLLHVGLDWSNPFVAPAFIPAAFLAALAFLAARGASFGRSVNL
jgi:serine/threonine protein kinase